MIANHSAQHLPHQVAATTPVPMTGYSLANAKSQSIYVPPQFQHPPPVPNYANTAEAMYSQQQQQQSTTQQFPTVYDQQFIQNAVYLPQTPQPSSNPYVNPDLLQHSKPQQTITNPDSLSVIPTFKSTDLMVSGQYKVYCSYVENGPKLFSVQLQSNEQQLDKMMDELGNVPLKNLQRKPTLGMACIARYSEDHQLYRAVIMNIMPTDCQVAYIDYGNAEQVAYKDIFEIPQEFLKHTTFANRFALAGYEDLGPMSERCTEYFKSLVMDGQLDLIVTPNDSPIFVQYCDLFLQNQSVLQILKDKLTENPTYSSPVPLTENDFVVIRYIESPKKFFVQRTANIAEYETMMDRFMLYCKTASPAINVCVGMACGAEYAEDPEWYRVEVLKITGQRALILYVDFGIMSEINICELKAITFEYLRMPRQAVECCLKCFDSIDNLSELARNQLEMLAEDTAGDRRNFQVRLCDKLPNSVYLLNLIDGSATPSLDLSMRMLKLTLPQKTYRYFEQHKFQKPFSEMVPNSGTSVENELNNGEVINSTAVSDMVASAQTNRWNDSERNNNEPARYDNSRQNLTNIGDVTDSGDNWHAQLGNSHNTTMWDTNKTANWDSTRDDTSRQGGASTVRKSFNNRDRNENGYGDNSWRSGGANVREDNRSGRSAGRPEYEPVTPQHDATAYTQWDDTQKSKGYDSNQQNSSSGSYRNNRTDDDRGASKSWEKNNRDSGCAGGGGGGATDSDSGYGRNTRRSPRSDGGGKR